MVSFRKKAKNKEDVDFETRGNKPTNKAPVRRRKKEPVKPWGRKERYIILAILTLTIGASGILGLYSRGWKLPGLPRLKIPSVEIPFIGEKTIVIEGNKEEAEKAKKVKSEFVNLTKKHSGIYGLRVVRLSGGSSYGVNEDDIMQAASLIKLPVMVSMYRKVEEGEYSLDTTYKLSEQDKVGGAGSLQNKPEGYEVTYRDLLRLMGQQSDNTAFNIVKNLLGEDEISNVIESLGMVNTSFSQNTTTPSDIGVFFERLWNGEVLNDENRNELLVFLTETDFEDWITAGLPEGTRFAHKFGRELHVVNDAGIVFGENPYVVVIMGDKIVEREVDEVIPLISKMIYEIETGVR